ncbi:metalloregulator ArsR/SmtB family transcription factor [uncultured Microbacterium sp.]|uniref:ArsR/SmtB family transcription factor n=1 Tax=uncultured Microbacterium sp. TaxID=191216 RepID=UPI003432344A
MNRGIAAAAELFKVLGSASRLELLHAIGQEPRTVGALVEATGMSQPLVSQHLRTLRQAGLVTSQRSGKEVICRLADLHVSHVIADALAHVRETAETQAAIPQASPSAPPINRERVIMTDTDVHAEHTAAEHEHGAACGHEAVPHGDHVDYVHGTHRHALHGDHYDEHESVAEHTPADHAHGADCGHDTVEHDGHVDYLHDGHKHAQHGDHYDEH